MARPAKVQVYQDRSRPRRLWRWRTIARNGERVGRSEQGYVRRGYCVNRAGVLNPGIPVEVL